MKNKQLHNIIDQHLLPYVEKPARYLGIEHHTIHKSPAGVQLRFAIAFPEVYEIAMSSQAINVLYHQLNRIDSIWAERVFAPWVDAESRMREFDIPLYSLESFTPLSEFDIIGFSLQYELTYTNILNMLDLARIPILAKDRKEGDPIIIGGGPCSCNPEPLAPFFDGFYIGDAEAGLTDLCHNVINARQNDCKREQILNNLVTLRGVYIPALYRDTYDNLGNFTGLQPTHSSVPPRIKTQIVAELKNEHYPEQPLVPVTEITHDRLAIEVMRGCTEGCRFCNAGMIYRPTRERKPEDIVQFTRNALSSTGFEEVSFLSLSISDYSGLNSLMKKEREAFAGEEINFSFPSMRLDSFSDEIAEFAKTVRKSGFTFAPETGSDRLRRVINKNITDDDLLKATRIALENGWKTLKFYFMIGLPTETKEDIESIIMLIERVISKSKGLGKIQLNISVSPHSPKAHTPFQWEKQSTREEFSEKIHLLKERLKKYRQVKLSWREPSVAQIECLLGRGDRRLGDVIFTAWQNGARFDGWTDRFNFDVWENAFIDKNLSMNHYLDELSEDAVLPWDHIDKGITKEYLLKERHNAYQEKTISDCKDGSCYGCGIQRVKEFGKLTECFIETELPARTVKNEQAIPEKQTREVTEDKGEQEISRYRIQYTKEGYSRFLAYFDIVRAFERACRRAKIKVVHSQGFNPRPRISFSSPLKLGYSSEAEFADLQVINTSADELKTKLNAFLPQGVKIVNIVQISSSLPSLMSSINASEYRVYLQNQRVPDNRIEKIMRDIPILVKRRVKKKEKKIDIRPYIDSIQERDHNTLTVHTNSIDGRTVRMDEILSELFHDVSTDIRSFPVHRNKQLIRKNGFINTPMEIR